MTGKEQEERRALEEWVCRAQQHGFPVTADQVEAVFDHFGRARGDGGMAYGIDLTLCKGPYVTRRQADAAATCEGCGGTLYVLTGNSEGFYVLPCICAAPEGAAEAEKQAAGEGAGG